GSCGHHAGFKGGDDGAAVEAPSADGVGGLPQGGEFGVGGGVAGARAVVVALAEQAAVVVVDEGADGWVVAGGYAGSGEFDGLSHPGVVLVGGNSSLHARYCSVGGVGRQTRGSGWLRTLNGGRVQVAGGGVEE